MTNADVRRPHAGRYLDRITAFSDGVVAIALTLLGLSLVDIPGPQAGQSVWDVLRSDTVYPTLLAFVITFVVISVMWMAHNRVFMFIDAYDGTVVWLNTLYLFSIVVLPFPSRLLQVDGFRGGVGTLYFIALSLSAGSLYLISRHVARTPALQSDEARRDPTLMEGSGAFFTAYFLIGVALSVPFPDGGPYYLLALWPLGKLYARLVARRAASR